MQVKMPNFIKFLTVISFLFATTVYSQQDQLSVIDYGEPKEYEIGGIKVTGVTFSDPLSIQSIAGIRVGDRVRIPGSKINSAMKALINLKLFSNVEIILEKTIGDVAFLEYRIEERPRLSRYSYEGVKKSFHEDLNEKLDRFLVKGGIVTASTKINAANAIKEFFLEKGYLDTEVEIDEILDNAVQNTIRLEFHVNRNEKVKIKEISFVGNVNVKEAKLRKQMKETKLKSKIFASSKFLKKEYEVDKKNIITYYNNNGFRDAKITKDSIWRNDKGELMIKIFINEGSAYHFRNISWKGNSLYESDELSRILGIAKGDRYNQELLESRLRFSQDGRDVSALYMDRGYLFFNIEPEEIAVDGDSIDLEMRIFEGPQATIDKVVIRGNDRTKEHVIRRELRTRPGQKFSRSDILFSQRALMALGYFNPETMGINTPVNMERATVDIEYDLEEKPSDQLELSAGYGGFGLIGTLGVTFNNFSINNIFKKDAWAPLPQGDGQQLSLRAQTNGRYFQSYNVSFMEPWMGGKKPNQFSISGNYNKFSDFLDASRFFSLARAALGYGSRMRWPDENFVYNASLAYQQYRLKDYTQFGFVTDRGEAVSTGTFNIVTLSQTIARSTIADPTFPKDGSKISLTVSLTPPYNKNRNQPDADLNVAKRFEWLEYHKWYFEAQWYTPVVDKLVLKFESKMGVLGAYDSNLGISPFERFVLGGDGLANQIVGITGRDLYALRGYKENELPANNNGSGGTVFNKLTMELRYPISTNPNSTIYVLGFVQGGNVWSDIKAFNPFDMKRSAGLGLRVFLPMFGTLGFDYGFGFDKPDVIANPASKWTDFGSFNIVLGFEPQ